MVEPERTPIILVSIDALRADHLGYHGYDRDTSPFLDRLADRELQFRTAISASSHTREAVPALLSGRYPDVFASNNYHYVPETIADKLSEAGYRTAGFHSNPYVSRAYGFDSGFDMLDDDLLLGQNRFLALAQRALNKFVLKKGEYHARAAEINERSLSWVDSQEEEPFFLWNHYMDPHGPYNPPEGYTYADRDLSNDDAQTLYQKTIDQPEEITEADRQLLIDSYDGEIRYLDEQLQAFFDALEDRNLLESSLIIVTADHGDAFGEHDYYTHPRHLHEQLLHVPLLVSPPGESVDVTVETPVSTLDIVPTILTYANHPSGDLPGSPLITESGLPDRDDDSVVYSSATGEDEHQGVRRFAARESRWKAVLEREIATGDILDERIFDLQEDPEEQIEHSPSEVDADGLVEEIRAFSASRLNAIDCDAMDVTAEETEEISERLEALGYK